MPGLVTKAAYARHRGVTRQAVDYALKVQRITAEPDGRIDVAKADAQWGANTHPIHGGRREAARGPRRGAARNSREPRERAMSARRGRANTARTVQDGTPSDAAVAPPAALPVPPAEPRVEEPAAPPEDSARTGLIDAKTRREQWQAQLAELDYRKRSGELIELAEVRRLVFAAGRAVRDALFAIPPRVSSVLAPEQSAREVQVLLEQELTVALESFVKLAEGWGASE